MIELCDKRHLRCFQEHMAACKLFFIDLLSFVPQQRSGADLLFELISQSYERGATLVTSILAFDKWMKAWDLRAWLVRC